MMVVHYRTTWHHRRQCLTSVWASAGSNIHALVEDVREDAAQQQSAAWAALEEDSASPAGSAAAGGLLPLATRTKAGLSALAEAIKACPGRPHIIGPPQDWQGERSVAGGRAQLMWFAEEFVHLGTQDP